MHRGISLLTCLLITGCALKNPQSLRVPEGKDPKLSHSLEEAKDLPLFAEGEWPSEDWWEMFYDEQLSRFIQTALDENPSLKAVESRTDQVCQEALVVRSKLFPTVDAFAGIAKLYPSDAGVRSVALGIPNNLTFYNLLLGFNYEFDFWGKNRNHFEAALGAYQTEKALEAQTKMILSISLAQVYFNLQAAKVKLSLVEELVKERESLLELVTLRKQQGIDDELAVNESLEELLAARDALVLLNEELVFTKTHLNILMGKEPDSLEDLHYCWTPERNSFSLPKHLGIDLIARRADLMAQIWKVESAAKMIKVAKAGFYPNVDLLALGGLLSLDFKDLFSKDALTSLILPLFQVPIYTGGRLRANLRSKVLQYEESVYEYQSMVLEAARQVVDGIEQLFTKDETVSIASERLQIEESSYRLISDRYEVGLDSLLKKIQRHEVLIRHQLEQVESERLRYQAIINLVKALGGGYKTAVELEEACDG